MNDFTITIHWDSVLCYFVYQENILYIEVGCQYIQSFNCLNDLCVTIIWNCWENLDKAESCTNSRWLYVYYKGLIEQNKKTKKMMYVANFYLGAVVPFFFFFFFTTIKMKFKLESWNEIVLATNLLFPIRPHQLLPVFNYVHDFGTYKWKWIFNFFQNFLMFTWVGCPSKVSFLFFQVRSKVAYASPLTYYTCEIILNRYVLL